MIKWTIGALAVLLFIGLGANYEASGSGCGLAEVQGCFSGHYSVPLRAGQIRRAQRRAGRAHRKAHRQALRRSCSPVAGCAYSHHVHLQPVGCGGVAVEVDVDNSGTAVGVAVE
jgi:hypothetical protein